MFGALSSFLPFLTGRSLEDQHPAEVISELTDVTGLSYSLGRPPTPELRDPGSSLPPTTQPQGEGQAGKLRPSKLKDTLLPGSEHQVHGKKL